MEIKVNGIALRCVDYKDNDVMLTLFTLERGLMGVCVRGVKKAGAKLRFAVQPFCFAEYIINEHSGRYTLTQATEIESFYKLRLDLNKYYSAMSILEFLLKLEGDEQPDRDTFILATNALKTLNFEDCNDMAVCISFIINALKNVGYSPRFKLCGRCGSLDYERGYFDFAQGTRVCESCANQNDMEIMYGTMKALSDISEQYPDAINGQWENNYLKRSLKFLNYFIYLKTGNSLTCVAQRIELP